MYAKKKPVLILDPSTELRFKDSTCELKITNPTDEQVYFKVMTTEPKQYTVRPNVKLLLPQESHISTIKFLAPPESAHKFMVKHVILPPGEATNIQDIWKNTKNEDIMMSKLKCVFEEDNSDASTKSHLLESQRKVDALTRELTIERSFNDSAKNEMDKSIMGQLQQLHNDKRILEQQMKAGYKEREDKIAELEEFNNDQVTKLDKMEMAMKQITADKQLLEEDYQAAKVQKAEMEQHINALQVQLEKMLDPLESIEELKEVEDLGEEIGRGAYGLVKKVSLHETICAAKDIHAILINYASDRELERIKKSFLEECVKCSKLFHPNIVQFLGIHYPSKQAKLPWLVMELLDCSLTGFVKKYDKESVSPFVKASIFCDVSLGLQFLHGRDIIHRDLSSNNVLLTKHLTAKISDLGVAKLVDPSGTKSHTVAPGTQHFLPPEVFSDAAKSHYGKPIDVFSLGCIMMHVATHEWPAPLPETHYDPKLKKKVALSEIERREAYLKQIQELPELKVLVESCLHDDPGLRPNATKMVDEVGKLKSLYQKKSSLVGNEMNAVEFEKHLKLQDKRISEQLLEIQKLNKMIQEAHA